MYTTELFITFCSSANAEKAVRCEFRSFYSVFLSFYYIEHGLCFSYCVDFSLARWQRDEGFHSNFLRSPTRKLKWPCSSLIPAFSQINTRSVFETDRRAIGRNIEKTTDMLIAVSCTDVLSVLFYCKLCKIEGCQLKYMAM